MKLLNKKLGTSNKLEHSSFKIMFQNFFGGKPYCYIFNYQITFYCFVFKKAPFILSTYNSTLSLPPKIFGWVSFVYVYKQQRRELGPRAFKCIFLGNFVTQKGYKCFHPPSRKFFVTDVTFNEQVSYLNHPQL